MTLATVLFKKKAADNAYGAVGEGIGGGPQGPVTNKELAEAKARRASNAPAHKDIPDAPPSAKPQGFMEQVGDMASKGWDATKDLGNKHLWGKAQGSPYAGGVSGLGDAVNKYTEGLQTGHVGTLAGTAGGIGAAALLAHLLFNSKKRRQA